MAFRAGGALSIDQEKYYMLNLCFSGVTFDLQAQVHSQIPLILFPPTANTVDELL